MERVLKKCWYQRFEQLPGNFFRSFSSISRHFAKNYLHAKFQINWTIQTEITESALSPPYQSAKSPACLGLIVFCRMMQVPVYSLDYTDIFSDILFRAVHGTLGFIAIYQSINVKCFEIPQCSTCMMILWFYAILRVFVLFSHYDYNISSKKLNAHRLWKLWVSKEHSFFFWNITFHNRNNY